MLHFFLAFGVSLSAAQELTPAAFRDFSGGYVDNIDSTNLQPNQSPNLQNVVVDDPVGSLKPRKGMTLCGNLPSGNKPTALYEYSKSDGTRRLIASDNANIYSTADCQTWTTMKTGLGTADQTAFATVRDKLWIVNGSTWAMTWDGTTLVVMDGRANTPVPTIPKCSFIEFWKERVWCGAPNGDASGLAFSALTDTNGNDLDPSTGTLSWPAANNFQIDQNAGSSIKGIKAYRNRMYAFKDNGIWEIGFDNDFSNFVRKTLASTGSRYQTSIAEVDGILYFTGKDGIYGFDGENSQRISGKIENKFRTLNQPLISQNYKTWTTQSDFEGGTLSSATAVVTPGSVLISSNPVYGITNGDFETGILAPGWRCSTAGTGKKCGINTGYGPIQIGVYGSSVSGGSNGEASIITLVSGSTLAVQTGINDLNLTTMTLTSGSSIGSAVYLKLFSGINDVSHATMYSDTFTFTGTVTFQYVNNGTDGFVLLDNFQSAGYFSTGTWTSEIYNTVTVSTWGAFTANGVGNGGSIAYEIRFGTDTGAVQSAAYSAIASGSLIPATTSQIHIQVRATLTAPSSLAATPELQDVQVAWNSGGANTQKMYAYGWKNSLSLALTIGTATTNNLTLNRARAPLDAWTLTNLQIGPMTTFNDNFYAGASTHSAVYRLDNGTNDDGTAINWFWESRDEMWGAPYNKKRLVEITADFKKDTATNAQIGYSSDSGASFSSRTVNMNGSGFGTTRQFVNGGNAFNYRLKVSDSTKDESATITGITGWVRPIPRRGD